MMKQIGWAVKDFADGWILMPTAGKAFAEARDTDQRVEPIFIRGYSELQPLVQCDCGRKTVCRDSKGLPRCYSCQTEDALRERSWHYGEPQYESKVQALIRRAFEKEDQPMASISCKDIREAFQEDMAQKRAMASMSFEQWRAANPLKTKEELANGLG